jgi:hypothetical protein
MASQCDGMPNGTVIMELDGKHMGRGRCAMESGTADYDLRDFAGGIMSGRTLAVSPPCGVCRELDVLGVESLK